MKRAFKAGLVLILPLAITIVILNFILDLLTDPFLHLITPSMKLLPLEGSFLFFTSDELVTFYSRIAIIIGFILILLLIGFTAKIPIIRSFYKGSDFLLQRLPIVNLIYKTLHDLITTIFGGQANAFKQVVIVPYPANADCYAIGFVTKQSFTLRLTHNRVLGNQESGEEKDRKEYLSILIPTTPNPTTGFLVIYEKKDVIMTQIKVEEAFKFIISFGVIHPTADFIQLNSNFFSDR